MSAAAARRLLRNARSAALATAEGGQGGWPYASLVTVACDCDAAPIFLFSRLADHTRNLQADSRASLLVEDASRRVNPQSGPRVTVLGRIEKSHDERHRRRFLARHPSAAQYAGFADFAIYRMTVERVHYVGGFSVARWIEGRDFTCTSATAIAAAEPAVIADINADGAATLYARRILGQGEDGWIMIGVDPEGCDLRRGHTLARLDFPRPVYDPEGLREILMDLARKP
jgi:hypothetical protein